MLFQINAPTSLYANCSPVVINDYKTGEPFYASNKSGYFNLPIGKYETDCTITRLSKFKPYAYIPQNAPIRKTGLKFYDEDSDVARIVRFDKSNKASFFPSLNIAVFANNIIGHWFIPCRKFAQCHEEGHNYYKPGMKVMAIMKDPFASERDYVWAYKKYMAAEHNCDVYAYNKLIRNGYNPNQVIQAIRLLLGDSNPRVQMLIDKINKANA